MTLIFTHLIAAVMGAGAAALALWCISLQRDLNAAQKALEAAQDRVAGQGETFDEYVARQEKAIRSANENKDDTKPTPDFMGGIGPSAIAARELYDRQQAQEKATPKFASPSVLNPDLKDIREAAREATNGGKPN